MQLEGSETELGHAIHQNDLRYILRALERSAAIIVHFNINFADWHAKAFGKLAIVGCRPIQD